MTTRANPTTAVKAAVIGVLLVVGACARSPTSEANDDAKKGWDSARSSDQLEHLRDRAVLVQTDR